MSNAVHVVSLKKKPVVAASDYVKMLPDAIARWIPRTLLPLGTEGYGRSETRPALRDFFEVDAKFVTLGALGLRAPDR